MSGLEKSTTCWGYPNIQVIGCPWLIGEEAMRGLSCDGD